MTARRQQPRPWRMVTASVGVVCSFAFAQSPVMTVDEAVALAETNHPLLEIARAEASAAAAELQESKALLWNNPALSTETRQRQLGQHDAHDVSRFDGAVGINQVFETGGQPKARRDATRASLSASEAMIEVTRREVRAEAEQRFYRVLSLQKRVKMEEDALDLLQRASNAVQQRVIAGEDSRLDGNLAAVEAERSANHLAEVREQVSQARSALATTLRLPLSAAPLVTGNLIISEPTYTLEELLIIAARHPKLQAASAREQAAQSHLSLERATRSPDLTVGLSYSPERGVDATDRITMLSLSVPLPLFRRNEGAIGRAVSDVERSRLERESAAREIGSTVRLLWQQQASLRRRVARLGEFVLSKVDENQRLSFKALEAGEIDLGQYLLVRRQTLDAQGDLLDVTAELLQTRVELEAAGGWPGSLPPIGVATRTETK